MAGIQGKKRVSVEEPRTGIYQVCLRNSKECCVPGWCGVSKGLSVEKRGSESVGKTRKGLGSLGKNFGLYSRGLGTIGGF